MNTDLFGKPLPQPAATTPPEKARRIGDVVMEHFRVHRYESFTAYQVSLAIGEQWSADAVKKAIIRGVQSGHIVVTGAMGKGRDGEPAFFYIYSSHKRTFR